MPEDVETRMGLGRALAASGDTAGGLEELHSAARIEPENAQVHLQLSRLPAAGLLDVRQGLGLAVSAPG